MRSCFLLSLAVFSYAIAPIARAADDPTKSTPAQPAPTNLAPIYVKIIWPDDPDAPAGEKDRPVIESWITKTIEDKNIGNRNQSNFRAVTGWMSLALGPLDTTELWDGTLDGKHCTCIVGADVFERKDGLIKVSIEGWAPVETDFMAQMKDEPGSRVVVPVPQAKNKHGVPHVAIFIGLQAK